MIEAKIVQHQTDNIEVHQLKMVCICGDSVQSLERRHEYNTRPDWGLERVIIELNDIYSDPRMYLDQWWGLSADTRFYLADRREYAFRVTVQSDDLRLGLLRMYEYIRERYEHIHNVPYDGSRFD